MVVVGRTKLPTLLHAGYLANSILFDTFLLNIFKLLYFNIHVVIGDDILNNRTLFEEECVNALLYKM